MKKIALFSAFLCAVMFLAGCPEDPTKQPGLPPSGSGPTTQKPGKVNTVLSTAPDVYNAFYEIGYNQGAKGPILITKGVLKTGTETQDVYLIWLSGTETVDGQDTSVAVTDKNAYADKTTNYFKSVLRTIRKDVPQGSHLIFAGHSLGGMIGQQIAGYSFIKKKYNVRTVLAFGSPPVGSIRCEGKAVRFADSSDIVPTLSYEYGNGLVDTGDKVISKDGGYGGDKGTSHSNSYKRADLWGMFDVLGVENGDAKVTLNLSTTKYYKAPSVFPEDTSPATYDVNIGGDENFVSINAKDKEFQMGNSNGASAEKPVHKVTLRRNFSMCKHEITQGEYEQVMGINPSNFKQPDTLSDRKVLPVEMCSWYDAIMYCNKRSLNEGLDPCYTVNDNTNPDNWNYEPNKGNTIAGTIKCDFNKKGYRLPTEAEWEFAARAGSTVTDKMVIADAQIENAKYTTHTTTEDKAAFVQFCKELCKFAWTYDNLTNEPHEVKMLEPNAWGLYDMFGNVCEWCWDKYSYSYPSGDQDDPNTGDTVPSKNNRVVRGGSYYLYSKDSSATSRSYAGADLRYYAGGWSYGIRVVRTED